VPEGTGIENVLKIGLKIEAIVYVKSVSGFEDCLVSGMDGNVVDHVIVANLRVADGNAKQIFITTREESGVVYTSIHIERNLVTVWGATEQLANPEEHKGWIEEVPTTLKGKYRIVDQETAQNARNLLEMAASLPAAAWKHCWWKAATGARHHTRIAWARGFPG
jgi:hypothetical protein